MAFQILDKYGKALTMGELDKEAAEFWGVEYNDKSYAHPKGYPYGDWFNTIGININLSPQEKHLGWHDIIGKLCGMAALAETSFNSIISQIEMYQPHIELCLYWQSKGYKPVSC